MFENELHIHIPLFNLLGKMVIRIYFPLSSRNFYLIIHVHITFPLVIYGVLTLTAQTEEKCKLNDRNTPGASEIERAKTLPSR